jgi:hypothetical protein
MSTSAVSTKNKNHVRVRTILDVISQTAPEFSSFTNAHTDNTTRTVNGTPTNDSDSGDFNSDNM